MRRRKHVSWLLNNNKTDVVEKLNNSLYKVFKNGISVTIGSSKTKKYIEYRLYNSVLADFLESFGSGSDMHLPADLLCSHKKYLLGLYNGLLDNGDLPYVHFNKHTSELFGVVNYLLYGYFPTVCDKKHKKMPIIRSESRITKEYQITDVTDVEHSSDAVIVYDLEVDDSTHSFIVNNAIVHNSLCSTRVVTGHGLPQLSVIEDCVRIKDMFPNVAIIADGGIRSSGDIIKAYAIGADAVMVGSMLSGTEETPGDWLEADGKLYKYYNGMASTAARSKWKGQSTGVPEEGISTKVLSTGKLAFQVVIGLAEAVKAGMTFSNARSLEELRRNAKWRRISAAGYIEGTPHRKREL